MFDSCRRDLYESFESLRLYVERNGCPNNYLVPEEQLVQAYLTHYEGIDSAKRTSRELGQATEQQRQKAAREQRLRLAEEQLEYVLNNEAELELTKHIPFRNYLMEYVVPFLNEGLLEVSNIIPDDPVELLAEFLFTKSNEV